MYPSVMIRGNGGGVTRKLELSGIPSGAKNFLTATKERTMEIEIWYIWFSYMVGTVVGWWMFRFSQAEREDLIKSSCDHFLHMLIAGDCVRVKECEDGELEILTIQEAKEAEEDK